MTPEQEADYDAWLKKLADIWRNGPDVASRPIAPRVHVYRAPREETISIAGDDYRSGVVVRKHPWWKRLRCALGIHSQERTHVGIPHYGWHVWCHECGRDWVDAD